MVMVRRVMVRVRVGRVNFRVWVNLRAWVYG